jgi:hypothetical protein
MPHKIVEQVLRTGIFTASGKPVDYRREVEEALAPLRSATLNLLSEKWQRGTTVDVIYLSGGGAELVYEQVAEAYPQTKLVPEAQMANARGYLNYAHFAARKQPVWCRSGSYRSAQRAVRVRPPGKEQTMAKRKTAKRRHRMITFKVFEDTDGDILDWWESNDERERSDSLRDVIRVSLGKQPRPHKLLTIPELLEVRQDTLWIRDALNDMPAFLERVIQQVAANAQPLDGGQTQPRASPVTVPESGPVLTDVESQRRTQRMRRATW